MKSVLKRFSDLPSGDKKLFLEALFFVYRAKFLTLIFSFQKCIQLISDKPNDSLPPDEAILESIRDSLLRTKRFIFWKNACLVQSMAARWMLRRRNINSKLIFGFNFDDNKKFVAHAWVTVDEVEIVAQGGEYKELHTV